MSADNIIMVLKIGGQYWVREWSASSSPYDACGQWGQAYPTRKAALAAAHDLEAKIGYVEYGIHEVT